MSTNATIYLGIDTGGTFTDFVLLREGQLTIHKVLSTPDAPEQAILQGIRELGLDQLPHLYIVHGSTVATNAVLEGKGVRTAFITNRGLGDMLTIGRQTRRELYNLQPKPYSPPVARELCLETGGRISAQGQVIEALTAADLQSLQQQLAQLQPRAVAINLLFSYLDDTFEKQIEALIPDDIFVTRSSFVLPEYKEYERGMTTWLNAYVGPIVQGYLQRLCRDTVNASVAVMQSAGGTISAQQAGKTAVNMLLSGPAGGLAAAKYIGDTIGTSRLLTFDMGGTSTDVALIDGEIQLTSEGEINHYPVAVPMVDMHTIGAGGGSIASIDSGGLLHVGPESAGAAPGPACYAQGGTQPTVTDANLVLGRLPASVRLAGNMPLDAAAAQRAVQTIAQSLSLSIEAAAQGIIDIANEHMAQALRVMSVQRGIDPRELCLVSFGGAGGLHVCALAELLGMRRALVPMHAGVLSALGMLVAAPMRQLSQTLNVLLSDSSVADINAALQILIEQGHAALLKEGVAPQDISILPSLDLRYQGQSYTLNVSWQDIEQVSRDFHAVHQQRYGHHLALPVQLVNVRVALQGRPHKITLQAETSAATAVEQTSLYGVDTQVRIYQRDAIPLHTVIAGPALIVEAVATTYLAANWQMHKDEYGQLQLQYIA